MMPSKLCPVIVLCSVAALCAGSESQSEPQPSRWEKTIAGFEEWDSKNTFASDAVLFVGSSSIRLWATRNCFPEFSAINRGFGGSHISDANYFFHRIVLPYEPRVIVLYAGDNDIAAGKSPQRVFNDYKRFVALVRDSLPATRIVFVGIKPSESRWSFWPAMKEANVRIEEFSQTDNRLFFFDSGTPLLGADGEPHARFFRDDKLHLNDEGYKVWTRLLRPVIEKAMRK